MRKREIAGLGLCLMTMLATPAMAQTTASATTVAAPQRDAFFWLGEINKASLVINTRQGLLDAKLAPHIATGLDTVLRAGDQPGGARPDLVITFEPLLIKAAGVEATLLHAGRSSQDMLATVRAAMYRDRLLDLAAQLRTTTATLRRLAQQYESTIVPNYTNGVAAQPNSYGHYLLGHVAGLQRDAQRLHELYARVDLSPMGTTVLNGTSWPLDRDKMAHALGFADKVDNAYDAAQIAATDLPVEIGAVATSIALHTSAFVQDVMVQYAQPRPWILLREGGGNTYVSSAMPQKRNPGLLNDTRTAASMVVTLGVGRAIAAHNIPPGMSDAKHIDENMAVIDRTTALLKRWDRVLNALVIDPQRALEELDSDWTASQEIADVLMREHGLPFRVGHHFASEVVDYAKAHDLRPSNFPYVEAQRIYRQTLTEMQVSGGELPMSEAQFRATLDPAAIVRHRATSGGPQPAEMQRMLARTDREVDADGKWIDTHRQTIDRSLASLDSDFRKYLSAN